MQGFRGTSKAIYTEL